MGGHVASTLAGRHPGRVRRLVVEDPPVPPRVGPDPVRMAEAAGVMPAASVVAIPVGHLVHVSAPEEFARLVLEFLA